MRACCLNSTLESLQLKPTLYVEKMHLKDNINDQTRVTEFDCVVERIVLIGMSWSGRGGGSVCIKGASCTMLTARSMTLMVTESCRRDSSRGGARMPLRFQKHTLSAK